MSATLDRVSMFGIFLTKSGKEEAEDEEGAATEEEAEPEE
jgi:hypothetical protein